MITQIVFLILKATQVIDWEWWAVLMPFTAIGGIVCLAFWGDMAYSMVEGRRTKSDIHTEKDDH